MVAAAHRHYRDQQGIGQLGDGVLGRTHSAGQGADDGGVAVGAAVIPEDRPPETELFGEFFGREVA